MNNIVKGSSENTKEGARGCLLVPILFVVCIVVSGLFFFVGKAFLGDEGKYYLFYGFILCGLAFLGFQGRWKKKEK
ncbi:MAG: hypothetical protein V4714_14825 [Bacteroidota bacterium]